jgi:hypothetical protein
MPNLVALFFRRRAVNYRQVFESPQGERVLADLLAFCDDPRIGSPNAIEMAQASGRMQVRKHLIACMAFDEGKVQQLLADEQQKRTREVA